MNGGVEPLVLVIAALVFVVASAVSALAYVLAAWVVQRVSGGAVGWTTAASLAAVAACAWLALMLAGYR